MSLLYGAYNIMGEGISLPVNLDMGGGRYNFNGKAPFKTISIVTQFTINVYT